MARIYCFFFVTLLIACNNPSLETIRELENPSKENSGESNLFADQDGTIYMSWIDIEDDTLSVLRYARLVDNKFGTPITISKGSDWFVNWADFPSVTRFPESKKLMAHWLQKSSDGTYDYDVRISTSDGKGERWSPSQILHNDGISAEHGFVSFTPYKYSMLATWLDGRKMKKAEPKDKEHNDHGHGSGAMTLRSAIIDIDNHITRRIELDNQVCECCQTDVAVTEDGPFVVYRNVTDESIRDIYYTRGIGEEWTIPKPIYNDEWKISGCPVNGPRVATHGKRVAVAWYSGADQKVKLVYSTDNGATFSDPLVINQKETLGRVDVAYTKSNEVYVSYLNDGEEEAQVMLRKLSNENKLEEPIVLGVTAPTRASGFPRLAVNTDHLYVSYTYVDSTSQKVVTRVVDI